MLQGIRIKKYRIFTDDRTGILLDDLLKMTPNSSLSLSAGLSPSIPMSNLSRHMDPKRNLSPSFRRFSHELMLAVRSQSPIRVPL